MLAPSNSSSQTGVQRLAAGLELLDSLEDSELLSFEDSELLSLEDSELLSLDSAELLCSTIELAVLDSAALLSLDATEEAGVELATLLTAAELLERLLLESLPPQPASVRHNTLTQDIKGSVIFMITSLYCYR